MAEKEERIYIDVENDDLDRLKHISMTRQDAINRMAKAMCSSDGESCKQCSVKNDKHACKSVLHDELFMEYAEAALNALLEDK